VQRETTVDPPVATGGLHRILTVEDAFGFVVLRTMALAV
jgi:hypothetical protein